LIKLTRIFPPCLQHGMLKKMNLVMEALEFGNYLPLGDAVYETIPLQEHTQETPKSSHLACSISTALSP